MYVPSIAHYIHKQNVEIQKQAANDSPKANDKDITTTVVPQTLKLYGIGVGNGWMDGEIQGPTVIEYAYWHGMIDSSTRSALHNEWFNCISSKDKDDDNEEQQQQSYAFHKYTIPDECGIMGAIIEAAGGGLVDWGKPNGYDVSTWDP